MSPSASTAAYPKLFPLPSDLTAVGDLHGLASPASAHTAELSKRYPLQLAHCGILSGIDFDGSFWDAVGGQSGKDAPLTRDQVGELINSTAGTIELLGPNAALFGTKSGLILGLARHDGQKDFTSCS